MPLRHVPSSALIAGWDFSTSGVKCLAFDLDGRVVAQVRGPTDLWTEGGVSELNLMQLEGQARSAARALAALLRDMGRLKDWQANGISATHHTAGRLDANHNQVRRAICWNDQSLAAYHAIGLKRLGGQKKVRELIGGPWAIRYSLSHLVKDEATLAEADWQRTRWLAQHGSLAAGYLTGNFETVSVSAAASTGMMDLRSAQWSRAMLQALEKKEHRDLAWRQLPRVVDQFEPVGRFSPSVCAEVGLEPAQSPLVFPTSDDQQAGLVGGGAVDAGQVALILGSSAVVNSSAAQAPRTDDLDCMRLNWGPYLWMRCYNNGAQFLNHLLGPNPDFAALEEAAREVPAGCEGTSVLPFVYPEPSLGVKQRTLRWQPTPPRALGKKYRAALEALAYLMALGVAAHEAAGQKITRITVSGGIARSALMCDILAAVLNRRLERLQSDEGPALGAAVTALAGLENQGRKAAGESLYTVAEAVGQMVKFKEPAEPNPAWREAYAKGLKQFTKAAKIKPVTSGK